MKNILVLIQIVLLSTFSFAQSGTQTVRGTVADADSKAAIPGVTVIIPGSSPLKGTTTGPDGQFKLENVPLGRLSLKLSFVGYEDLTIPNIVADAGTEVVLELQMQESVVTLDEIVVSAYQNKGEVINEMALVSGRSVSIEETKRYAGGFNDPALILSNFAGVTTGGSNSNEVIIRGNSPKYVQWQLEGLEITNPNHFGEQNGIGGAISALNNNLLATSDFYTGAFSPSYGNVLSGVYDVNLRKGNNQKFESVLGIGLLGMDVTVEGPFKKDYAGSFLANYRYSTAGLVADMGLVDIDGGVPKFQDGAFNLRLPTKKAGVFSLFGLGALSSIKLVDMNPGSFAQAFNDISIDSVRKDVNKNNHLLNLGVKHIIYLNKSSFLKTTVGYSSEGSENAIVESDWVNVEGSLPTDVRNSRESFTSRTRNSAFRPSISYNNKINAKNRIQIGLKYAYMNAESKQSVLDLEGDRFTVTDFDQNLSTLNSYVSWKHRFNENVTMVAGLQNMNVIYNSKSTIEPRIALNWKLTDRSTFNAGYGKHSMIEKVHNYFARVEQNDGTISEPNHDLDLLKAHHFVLGYEYRFSKNLVAKIEGYYQHLYDIPVENDVNSHYSTLNEGVNYRYTDLVNAGTGRNYGVEMNLERFFNNNYYFLINASLFESKYKSLDGVERNTAYADNYIVNILAGKDFVGLGKNDNQTLSLNAKLFYGGGKKHIALIRDDNGQAALDPSGNALRNFGNAYENSLDPIFLATVSASYKWNRQKTTHELFLNIDNVSDNRARISEFYDDSKENSTGYVKMFGFFPNLMYRIYL